MAGRGPSWCCDRAPRVLLVDDDERYLAASRREAARANIELHTAPDRETAVAVATTTNLDVTAIDLALGMESGLVLLGQLRAVGRGGLLVVVSSMLTIDRTVEAMSAGASDVVEKPISPSDLVDRCRHGAPGLESPDTRSLDEVIERHVTRVQQECSGNISETARRLKIQRSTLRERLARIRRDDT